MRRGNGSGSWRTLPRSPLARRIAAEWYRSSEPAGSGPSPGRIVQKDVPLLHHRAADTGRRTQPAAVRPCASGARGRGEIRRFIPLTKCARDCRRAAEIPIRRFRILRDAILRGDSRASARRIKQQLEPSRREALFSTRLWSSRRPPRALGASSRPTRISSPAILSPFSARKNLCIAGRHPHLWLNRPRSCAAVESMASRKSRLERRPDQRAGA